MNSNEIRKAVRKSYGKVASQDKQSCGCNPDSCCGEQEVPTHEDVSRVLGYSDFEMQSIPKGANLGLGCGNPQAIAALKAGESVLDLGSGAGFDAFLASHAVGSKGQVIGVDMTPEMLSKARNNAEKNGYSNVQFRLGEIEQLPVEDEKVDVIISNCVVNLSPNKQAVFDECFRVLKVGGRLAISDIVATAELPQELLEDMELLTGCMSGAERVEKLEKMLQQSGFTDLRITPKDASKTFICSWAPGSHVEDYLVSASIEAIKPLTEELSCCCGSEGC